MKHYEIGDQVIVKKSILNDLKKNTVATIQEHAHAPSNKYQLYFTSLGITMEHEIIRMYRKAKK